MSSASQFGGGRKPTKSIQSAYTSSGWSGSDTSAASGIIAGGSFSAQNYKTLLSISGAGELSLLALLITNSNIDRTVSVQMIIDGYYAHQSSRTGSYGNAYLPFANSHSPPIVFNNSFVFQVASNYTESDLCSVRYIYNTY